MRHILLAAVLLIPASAIAQEDIELPSDRPKDSDRTYLQCYAAPTADVPDGADLISTGADGSRVYMDQHGGVSMLRTVNGQPEVCLVVNWTGGSL